MKKTSQKIETTVDLKPIQNESRVVIPEGVALIPMPRFSEYMEKLIVDKWHKKVGDTIKEGDALADIETDKTTMELESFYKGTLLYAEKEDKTIPIDGLIAIIGPSGTDVSEILKTNK